MPSPMFTTFSGLDEGLNIKPLLITQLYQQAHKMCRKTA